MNAVFQDLDDDDNPMNGTTIAKWADIQKAVEQLRDRRPFMIQLQLDDGSKLDVGLAREVGCVQHSPIDGMPPYRMATTKTSSPMGQRDTEFSVGGTATPIDNRYCLPMPVVEMIVENSLHGRPLEDGVVWESF